MRVVQIFDDGFEALYSFNDDVTDKQIKLYYREYLEQKDDYFYSFEDFMEEKYPASGCERFFVDSEIYI